MPASAFNTYSFHILASPSTACVRLIADNGIKAICIHLSVRFKKMVECACIIHFFFYQHRLQPTVGRLVVNLPNFPLIGQTDPNSHHWARWWHVRSLKQTAICLKAPQSTHSSESQHANGFLKIASKHLTGTGESILALKSCTLHLEWAEIPALLDSALVYLSGH